MFEHRVAAAFGADRRGVAVAGEDAGGVGEGHDAGQGGAEVVDVGFGEIPAADGAGEEEVAGDEELLVRAVEGDVAGGVAGGVECLEFDGADRDELLVGDGGVGIAAGDGVGERHRGAAGFLQERFGIGVDEDFASGESLRVEGVIAEVVPVAVGEEEEGEVKALLGCQGQEGGDGVARGVDENAEVCGFIEEEVAVGGGQAAGVHVDFHEGYCRGGGWQTNGCVAHLPRSEGRRGDSISRCQSRLYRSRSCG
jgi:hypothetical protein